MTRFLAWHRRYVAHDDPAAATANLVALVIAWNGPFYPIYVIALIGWPGLWSFLTMLASPLFFAVPRVARLNSAAGRAALPLLGALDTVGSTKLLGAASGVGLFVLPCLILCALLYRRGERWLMLPLLGLVLASVLIPASVYGAAIMPLTPNQATRLTGLNLVSVAALIAFLTLQFAAVMRQPEAVPAAAALAEKPGSVAEGTQR
jgi:hypothetical protein